jgi:hypothetical protein
VIGHTQRTLLLSGILLDMRREYSFCLAFDWTTHLLELSLLDAEVSLAENRRGTAVVTPYFRAYLLNICSSSIHVSETKANKADGSERSKTKADEVKRKPTKSIDCERSERNVNEAK